MDGQALIDSGWWTYLYASNPVLTIGGVHYFTLGDSAYPNWAHIASIFKNPVPGRYTIKL
jgi:hypothetical protein